MPSLRPNSRHGRNLKLYRLNLKLYRLNLKLYRICRIKRNYYGSTGIPKVSPESDQGRLCVRLDLALGGLRAGLSIHGT